ncbi:HEPN domain-containing protein [Synechococcus sp. RC10A2]|jgi:uncharacterized protein (UPF0332 family)|uniref:HEPN domain-containing protein n=1 Tax=Synechococcus sp. RC10A2 TaxID=2964529 RepID=UPI0039C5ED30
MFDWYEYLRLATELAGHPIAPASEEARQRSAISRAYYAAFCKCRNYLQTQGYQVSRESLAHTQVRNLFKQSQDRRLKQVGHHLDRLRSDRNMADYEDYFADIGEKTELALELANRIFSMLSELEQP